MPATRRTQSERTAETRAALIEATIALLMERGMQGATVQEICKRAGVTTGAIQHQFGSKNGLMNEVVQTLFEGIARSPGETTADSLEARIDRVIEHYWSIYTNERYYAVLEILLATRHDPDLMHQVSGYRDRQLSDGRKAMALRFPDVTLSPAEMMRHVQRVIDFMRGYALRRIYERSEELDRQARDTARSLLLQPFGARHERPHHDA